MEKSKWHKEACGRGRHYMLGNDTYIKYDDKDSIVARITDGLREFIHSEPAIRISLDSPQGLNERAIIAIPYQSDQELILSNFAILIYQSLMSYYVNADPSSSHFGISNAILEGSMNSLLRREMEKLINQFQSRDDMAGRLLENIKMVGDRPTEEAEPVFLSDTIKKGLDIHAGFRIITKGINVNCSRIFIPVQTGKEIIDRVYQNIEQMIIHNFVSFDETGSGYLQLTESLIFKDLESLLRRSKEKENTRKKILNNLQLNTILTEEFQIAHDPIAQDRLYDALNRIQDSKLQDFTEKSNVLYATHVLESKKIFPENLPLYRKQQERSLQIETPIKFEKQTDLTLQFQKTEEQLRQNLVAREAISKIEDSSAVNSLWHRKSRRLGDLDGQKEENKSSGALTQDNQDKSESGNEHRVQREIRENHGLDKNLFENKLSESDWEIVNDSLKIPVSEHEQDKEIKQSRDTNSKTQILANGPDSLTNATMSANIVDEKADTDSWRENKWEKDLQHLDSIVIASNNREIINDDNSINNHDPFIYSPTVAVSDSMELDMASSEKVLEKKDENIDENTEQISRVFDKETFLNNQTEKLISEEKESNSPYIAAYVAKFDRKSDEEKTNKGQSHNFVNETPTNKRSDGDSLKSREIQEFEKKSENREDYLRLPSKPDSPAKQIKSDRPIGKKLLRSKKGNVAKSMEKDKIDSKRKKLEGQFLETEHADSANAYEVIRTKKNTLISPRIDKLELALGNGRKKPERRYADHPLKDIHSRRVEDQVQLQKSAEDHEKNRKNVNHPLEKDFLLYPFRSDLEKQYDTITLDQKSLHPKNHDFSRRVKARRTYVPHPFDLNPPTNWGRRHYDKGPQKVRIMSKLKVNQKELE